MKTEILKELKGTDGYVSGQELCEKFGVSRTAVWKVINQLKEEGYDIEAVRNKGYRLAYSGDLLSREEIVTSIRGQWAGRQVEYLQEVDSTNTRAKQMAESGAPHGLLVVAECQTMGKGRRGRSWVSPPGANIFMSLLLRPEIEPTDASMLTLVAAMAVTDGIRKVTGLETGIKWPNDVVIDGKKVCGILTEMSTEFERINYVVPGIGINVNQEEYPEERRATATSLKLALGRTVKRSELIGCVMEAFERYYGIFLETMDLSGLMDEYNGMLVNKGREVRVLAPKNEYTGVSLGINRTGELLVRTEDGSVREVLSGEVSVRGIYGYV